MATEEKQGDPLRVQMEPMTRHVNGGPELKEESPFRIEHRQDEAETHGRTSVDQHVEHGAKLRA